MTLSVDLYWSFRSPYSYLVTGRVVALARDYDVDVHVRPVYPLAVRKKGFFTAQDPLWIPYLLRDITRTADFVGIPIQWPNPDPVLIDPETRDAVPDQPHIHRLTRMGVLAAERGQGVAFLDEVSRLIWRGEHVPWNDGAHLRDAVARAGLDLEELDSVVERDTARLEGVIEQNQVAHREAGHWGVPTLAFQGEPFFGQDRFDQLVWRLEQYGLKPRN